MTSSQFVSRWRGADLGLPIPEERHAVSVCLPRWRDNVGYEEGDPTVTGAMQCGYPRFFFHPDTARLFAECERQLARPGECDRVSVGACRTTLCGVRGPRNRSRWRVGAGFDGRVHAVLMPLARETRRKRSGNTRERLFLRDKQSHCSKATWRPTVLARSNCFVNEWLSCRVAQPRTFICFRPEWLLSSRRIDCFNGCGRNSAASSLGFRMWTT